MKVVVLIAASYLIGSISFALVIAKLQGIDLREIEGSIRLRIVPTSGFLILNDVH